MLILSEPGDFFVSIALLLSSLPSPLREKILTLIMVPSTPGNFNEVSLPRQPSRRRWHATAFLRATIEFRLSSNFSDQISPGFTSAPIRIMPLSSEP